MLFFCWFVVRLPHHSKHWMKKGRRRKKERKNKVTLYFVTFSKRDNTKNMYKEEAEKQRERERKKKGIGKSSCANQRT